MTEYLLKRALPFSLTFIIGAAAGGFFNLFGAGAPRANRYGYTYTYEGGRGCAKKFRRHRLVHETRSPLILFKPDARWPLGVTVPNGRHPGSLRVNVTFGADGKVAEVSPAENRLRDAKPIWSAVESAARQIRFEPGTSGGMPVTVTQEIEIRFLAD